MAGSGQRYGYGVATLRASGWPRVATVMTLAVTILLRWVASCPLLEAGAVDRPLLVLRGLVLPPLCLMTSTESAAA
jgi:hypothetical protein